MLKKIIFLVLFTPIHAIATLMMVQRFFFNPRQDAGAMETICKITTFIFTLSAMYPCMRIDPDGESFPRLFVMFLPFFNSLVWAVLLLLVFHIVRRLGRKSNKGDG